MTEEDWFGDAATADMTAWVCPAPHKSSLVSPRKFRLYAVACARQLPPSLFHTECDWALDTAEAFADSVVSLRALKGAASALINRSARVRRRPPETPQSIASTACSMVTQMGWFALQRVPERVAEALKGFYPESADLAERLEVLKALLCDIVGNPFRPVAFDPNWRTSTAVALATQMYESRDFGIMPILADALQDAGCDSDDVLTHCRGDGPHVHGCWVVDLVLGKE